MRLALTAALPVVLAACGGGGGTGTGTGSVPTPPIVTASPTIPPSSSPGASAIARGTVVDEAAGTPLAGITVALSPATANATPAATTTTGADGSFALTVPAGSYLLRAGSDAPADVRATYHAIVSLAAGSNTVTAPAPQPVADATYTAAQSGGALRLAALTASEQDCLSGANQGRTQRGLPSLVPDELLLEDARAVNAEELAQDTDTPAPLFPPYPQPPSFIFAFAAPPAIHAAEDFSVCDQWTGPRYAYYQGEPPYADATNPAYIWTGVTFSAAPPGAAHPYYGAQLWAADPRG